MFLILAIGCRYPHPLSNMKEKHTTSVLPVDNRPRHAIQNDFFIPTFKNRTITANTPKFEVDLLPIYGCHNMAVLSNVNGLPSFKLKTQLNQAETSYLSFKASSIFKCNNQVVEPTFRQISTNPYIKKTALTY